MSRIGVLAGSFRAIHGNGDGIATWVAARLKALQASRSDIKEILVLDQDTAPLPLGPLRSRTIAAAVKDVAQYDSPQVREWSKLVSSLSGLVIVTPQYNHGYPGELKNALDHIYHEWKDLPVAIFTFGGRGGSLCGAQLTAVLDHGFKTKIVSTGKVEIKLPYDYITGDERYLKDQAEPAAFLTQYETVVDEELQKLVEAAKESGRGPK